METKIVDTDDPVHGKDSQHDGEEIAVAESSKNVNELRNVLLRQVLFFVLFIIYLK